MVAVGLMVASVSIIALLGVLHLLATYRGPKLHPVDNQVKNGMEQSNLMLTNQTTVWRAWVGFNASHSLGALLFGAVYGYLAVAHKALLFASGPLLSIGMITLCAYWWLARRYWFSVPFNAISVSLGLYALAWASAVL